MKRIERNLVTVTIDGEEYELPEGMNLVDAAKMAGNDIPVFCYHPKLGHAGNCRMCLVELGTPRRNRETGEMELAWFPTLQTACTQYVSDGMSIKTTTDFVKDGRREILEFLLSSHPLDCPICDKGGECPLQNLTMEHGPGTSRMYWNDKMRLGKHIPLGEIIYLDQERCIHCARCIRFQDEIVDDPVLSFDARGRKQRIITNSEPGFDSIWSGNTTDICPVGALTTADFRFNARPWEMVQVGSIDTHGPEGANITYDTRIERAKGGRTTIKRIMPRQNEWVNEIWISDKTRFVHHYMEHPDRLTTPLIRKGGELVEATWDEALDRIATQLRDAGENIAAIAGPRLANEDYFALQEMVRGQGSHNLAAYPANVQGAELVNQVGVAEGTNLKDLDENDAVLVIATDLHQEAPIWWLRLKQAAERGTTLIVVSGRPTRLDKWAAHVVRIGYGEEVATLQAMHDGNTEAAKAFIEAENAIAIVGGEGFVDNSDLTQAAANLLIATDHVGKPDNGLILVWPGANLQGAHDMGVAPTYGPGYAEIDGEGYGYADIIANLGNLGALIIAGADPAFDEAAVEQALSSASAFIVVQDMFLTRTAEHADVVLPTQSVGEREGTYTNGERRVQRFYQGVEPIGDSRPDWKIARLIAQKLGQEVKPEIAATQVFAKIAKNVPQYAGMSHAELSQVVQQFPDVGGDDLYYGGTAFTNAHGIGLQWETTSEQGETPQPQPVDAPSAVGGELVIVPTTVIYDREHITTLSEVIAERIPESHLALSIADAERLGISAGDTLYVPVDGRTIEVAAHIDEELPEGVALLPRRLQAHAAPLAAFAATPKLVEKVNA